MFALTDRREASTSFNTVMTYLVSFAFLLLCANAKVLLPISPVPITMHTFAIAVLGCLLPFRVALTCFLAYLVEGLLGSPLFGIPLSFGPSFGYFVGMIVSLFFLNRVSKSPKIPLLLSLVGSSLIIWSFGVLHLQFLVGLKTAFLVGVVPFVAGDLIKLFLAYSLIQFTLKKAKA